MNDNHINVIDMYDANAKPQDELGRPAYKAYENDRTQTQQELLRIFLGTEEGETLIPYSLFVKIQHRPLVRLLVDQQLPDAVALGDEEYGPTRAKLKAEAMMQVNALETEIISMSLLDQVAVIQERVGMLEQLLLFDTNSIHILEGRNLDKLIEPIQDRSIRNLYCFNDSFKMPPNEEPLITEVTEYEFNNRYATIGAEAEDADA